MIRQWKLKKPDIVISVHGGLKNFKLDPHHKEIFNRGLIKAAKTTHSGAWIITGNADGLVKHKCMKQIFNDKGSKSMVDLYQAVRSVGCILCFQVILCFKYGGLRHYASKILICGGWLLFVSLHAIYMYVAVV